MAKQSKQKYILDATSKYKKQFKKAVKQGKDIDKLREVVNHLLCGEELEKKYRNHELNNNHRYNNCWECHIEPD